MKKFKIGGVPEHFNLPWRMAIERGELDQMRTNIHWSDMPGGTGQMIKGLRAGSIDIAVLLTEGITKAILEGLPAEIVSVYVQSPLTWGIHSPVGSVKELRDLEDSTFAISREGSGSHLMSYVLADREGWKAPTDFEVVGDVYGGLWALENNRAKAFLWERFTTQPFVDLGKCQRVGEIKTPWPSFVVAARSEVLERDTDTVKMIVRKVLETAQKVKKWSSSTNSHPSWSAQEISWRYGLKVDQAQMWLDQTFWADKVEGLSETQLVAVNETLKKLNL
ncbi:MAG: ABC transporter substrate-binding protein, partial [Actinobacteria bacterium]|nr:ABC transporter substrate-binding protein [Actinomycetota bacterium]